MRLYMIAAHVTKKLILNINPVITNANILSKDGWGNKEKYKRQGY
jgi:hypothetical protein